MALDRQTIEKKDFPISRRGYDTDAVDTHLRLLSEEVEDLKRSSRRAPESLATTAAQEVQAIVSAAETAAAKIQGDAEREADEIRRQARNDAKNTREEADRDASSTREQATAQASEYVSGVSESTSGLLQRVESVDRELGSVIDTLRSAAQRLQSELGELEGSLRGVQDAVSPRHATGFGGPSEAVTDYEPEATQEAAPEGALEAEPELAGEFEQPAVEIQPQEDAYQQAEEETEISYGPPPTTPAPAEPSPEASLEEPAAQAGESPADGARLIALNMALNGAPREEVDRYLAENFELPDRTTLIDEVYAAIEE